MELLQLQPFAAAVFLKLINYFWLGNFIFLLRIWVSVYSSEGAHGACVITCFSALLRLFFNPHITTLNLLEIQSMFSVWLCAQLISLLIQFPFRIKLFIYSLEISSSLDVNEANQRVRALITSKLWTFLQILSLNFYLVATFGLPLYWS